MKTNDKTGATFGLTFAAMNPKKAGKQMYDLVYEPMDAEGNIVNKSGETVVWD